MFLRQVTGSFTSMNNDRAMAIFKGNASFIKTGRKWRK
jgi:hypothetical protein